MTPKIVKRGRRLLVRYDEYLTIADAEGEERVRKERTRSFGTLKEAAAFSRAIVAAHATGARFVPASERPESTLRGIVVQYAQAATNLQTKRSRASLLNKFLAFAPEGMLASDLSRSMLIEYGRKLVSEGLKSTDRYVGQVEALWKWADEGEFHEVPRPKRVVGREVERVPRPWAPDTPSWAESDAVISQLTDWKQQAVLILRYTGIRASQALTLERDDIDLDRGILRLRIRVRGAKRAARARAVPLHPSLLASMRSWPLPARGLLFRSTDRRRKTPGVYDEDRIREPMTRAWESLKISERKWGAEGGDRTYARPVHVLRGAFKASLLRSGVDSAIVNILVGHSAGAVEDAYIPMEHPESSPNWEGMKAALQYIPAFPVTPSRRTAAGPPPS